MKLSPQEKEGSKRWSQSTSDNDLTGNQKRALSNAFREFILNNNGADISGDGTTVRRYPELDGMFGGSSSDESLVRATTQFVGANLEDGWQDTIVTLTTNRERLERGTDARIDRIRNEEYPNRTWEILIDPVASEHRTNPSSIARALTHEYLHRPDQMGLVYPHNARHRNIDNTAKELIRQWGLDGLGCPATGGGFYSGC